VTYGSTRLHSCCCCLILRVDSLHSTLFTQVLPVVGYYHTLHSSHSIPFYYPHIVPTHTVRTPPLHYVHHAYVYTFVDTRYTIPVTTHTLHYVVLLLDYALRLPLPLPLLLHPLFTDHLPVFTDTWVTLGAIYTRYLGIHLPRLICWTPFPVDCYHYGTFVVGWAIVIHGYVPCCYALLITVGLYLLRIPITDIVPFDGYIRYTVYILILYLRLLRTYVALTTFPHPDPI